jgi:hemoglobin-like flavoprotein
MFRGDMTEQGRKLMHLIGVAVEGLEDRHYDTVAAALLWTLERGLGESFTPEVRDAWAAAYEVLSSTMKAGATRREAALAHA